MIKQERVDISPSLICTDLCNVAEAVQQLEVLGIRSLHVDLIDGHFSPSMPLGLATVAQLRKRCRMDFDVHVMATDNEFFIKELLAIGVQSITFHYEAAFHVERLLQLIKAAGCQAGIALNPATPLSVLDYVLEHCDYVLLMLISPGYAGNQGETMVPYALRKIEECRQYIRRSGRTTRIMVDGRVSLEAIPAVVAAGADCLVAGSTSLFSREQTLAENYRQMKDNIARGLAARKFS